MTTCKNLLWGEEKCFWCMDFTWIETNMGQIYTPGFIPIKWENEVYSFQIVKLCGFVIIFLGLKIHMYISMSFWQKNILLEIFLTAQDITYSNLCGLVRVLKIVGVSIIARDKLVWEFQWSIAQNRSCLWQRLGARTPENFEKRDTCLGVFFVANTT